MRGLLLPRRLLPGHRRPHQKSPLAGSNGRWRKRLGLERLSGQKSGSIFPPMRSEHFPHIAASLKKRLSITAN